jgi:hypothetical protein
MTHESSLSASEFTLLALSAIGDSALCTDIAGRVCHLNAVAEILTSLTLAESCGLPCRGIFPDLNDTTEKPRPQDPAQLAFRQGMHYTFRMNS